VIVSMAGGRPLSVEVLGTGPAVVFVHGSIATGDQWRAVADLLADRFTCYLMDRSGRGGSAPVDGYSITVEAEDVTAVLQAVAEAGGGEAPAVLGHSYGAICVLEALYRGASPARVILYEPPLPVDGPVAGAELSPFRALVESGDLDAALTHAMTKIVHMPDEVVAGMREAPVWPGMAALSPTWVRELAEIDSLPADVNRYAEVRTPTLMLLGELTAPHHRSATKALGAVLPVAQVHELTGQEHFAQLVAPVAVAAAIAEFLSS
jgi:pimeloyl-ACP methyl ester carboxylesterase